MQIWGVALVFIRFYVAVNSRCILCFIAASFSAKLSQGAPNLSCRFQLDNSLRCHPLNAAPPFFEFFLIQCLLFNLYLSASQYLSNIASHSYKTSSIKHTSTQMTPYDFLSKLPRFGDGNSPALSQVLCYMCFWFVVSSKR